MSNTTVKEIVTSVEELQGEIDQLKASIRDVYEKARDANLNVKAIKQIIRERKLSEAEAKEFRDVVEQYRVQMGMGPLFDVIQRGAPEAAE